MHAKGKILLQKGTSLREQNTLGNENNKNNKLKASKDEDDDEHLDLEKVRGERVYNRRNARE